MSPFLCPRPARLSVQTTVRWGSSEFRRESRTASPMTGCSASSHTTVSSSSTRTRSCVVRRVSWRQYLASRSSDSSGVCVDDRKTAISCDRSIQGLDHVPFPAVGSAIRRVLIQDPHHRPLSVLSHDILQLWGLDYLVNSKSKFLINFLCFLIEIKNC